MSDATEDCGDPAHQLKKKALNPTGYYFYRSQDLLFHEKSVFRTETDENALFLSARKHNSPK